MLNIKKAKSDNEIGLGSALHKMFVGIEQPSSYYMEAMLVNFSKFL